MKILPSITLLLIAAVASTQPFQGRALETRDANAQYISKQQLNYPSSTPKINGLNDNSWFISHQVNVDSNHNNILNDAANEPSIAVNPLNPNQIAVGWRQFNTRFNSFRQGGRSYSEDGGETWNFQQPFEPSIFRSDPVLAANADGQFYYQSLRVDFDSQGNATNFNVDQWKSYDGGKTWVEKTFAYGGDKSWIVVDTTNNITRGNIYAAWNVAGNQYFPNTFNSSTDAGMSFSSPVKIPKSPVFGTVDVNSQGDLYVIGIDGEDETATFGDFYLIRSINPSVPMPTFSQVTKVDLAGPLVIGTPLNPAGLNGQIYVKIDKSNRASKDNVYVLGSVNPPDNDPLDIQFVRSTDKGVSFSAPRRINTDNTKDKQWFGTMSIAPNGRIDVIWNDTRNNDGTDNVTDTTSRLFYTYSYDAGMTFAKEQAVSPRFNHTLGYPVQQKMGDYIDMVSDNKAAHIIYTATFNGEQDVYYLNARPSAVEENPDFPTILTNNAWASPGVPSQGILSTTLINNGNATNPLLTFDALFTAKPDGTPMWLIATGEKPIEGDSYQIPLFMPTGDLSEKGQALMAIGMVTKTRLRDENNELIDNKMAYTFDMTDAVKPQLQKLGAQYSEEFFNNNPFHNINKTLDFNSLLPREQLREDLCNINGQVLVSDGEKNEGRVQFTYKRDDLLQLFSADFTYKKTINPQGDAVIDLNDEGLATPTWETLQSNENGIAADNSVQNHVYRPNGGLGFFEKGEQTGISEIGLEQVTVENNQLTSIKPDKTTEVMHILANNAYCGEIH